MKLPIAVSAALADADHLAAVTDRLLAAIEDLATAEVYAEEGDAGLAAVWQAEEHLAEQRRAAERAIHEYRKRVARVRAE